MNRRIKIFVFLIPLFAFSIFVNGQNSRKQERKERPSFIEMSAGLSISNFRDFATSPLVYRNISKYFSLSKTRVDSKKETEFLISYSFGNFKSDYNEHFALSQVKTGTIYYSRLYNLDFLNTEKLNFKLGGIFLASANFRSNASLQNNSTGIEIIPNLMGSIKITKDISRKSASVRKFLFFKWNKPARKRNLSFQFNIGVLNGAYRNGYAYSGQSAVLNDPKLFDDYQFNLSGFRMSSALDYKIFLKNKNAIKLSYLWDAYKTGSDFETFEMAHHTFKFTFMFNTNNR